MPGLAPDQMADFCFFLGDLNYRLKSSFKELNNSTVDQLAVGWAASAEKEQLKEAMAQGYYPGYVEQPITFLPSYKMSATEEVYIDKKDQAPSYCDRVLFKSNQPSEWTADFYRCLHDFHGSDHRPVQLGLTLHNFGQPKFQDLNRLIDMSTPRQGYGLIQIKLVSISSLDFQKSFVLSHFMSPKIKETLQTHKLKFRTSFYDVGLDRITAPITYSTQSEMFTEDANSKN